MLKVDALNQYYGGSHILRDISFTAPIGQTTCLLGRNGVGKSTLLKCLMGQIPARSGEIVWQGKRLNNTAPHQRVAQAVAYVPQGREICPRWIESSVLIHTQPDEWVFSLIKVSLPRQNARFMTESDESRSPGPPGVLARCLYCLRPHA